MVVCVGLACWMLYCDRTVLGDGVRVVLFSKLMQSLLLPPAACSQCLLPAVTVVCGHRARNVIKSTVCIEQVAQVAGLAMAPGQLFLQLSPTAIQRSLASLLPISLSEPGAIATSQPWRCLHTGTCTGQDRMALCGKFSRETGSDMSDPGTLQSDQRH